ncbi:hypothetical protein [Algoriphagus sp. CAU 1675]|uniref:hypothetical protein n=1 Tax=Algoriphagus sp. CAU 1675 TaxID=3032597 RepID=UPI0023DCC8AF|nr:hypothetical protein [Algoriphagus sp. CAU 1675]MDF2158480.1 hypothetical protein [Algoriphagus sp. CAU 1675]
MNLSFILHLQDDKTFQADYIFIDGLAFHQQGVKGIFENYGPTKFSNTNYECGFFSNEEQGKTFYELIYKQVTWIGNNEEGFLAELVRFDPEGRMKWSYKGIELSGKSTQKEIESFMDKSAEPIKFSGRDDDNLFSVGGYFQDADDGFFLLLKQGYLIEFHYWSPC